MNQKDITLSYTHLGLSLMYQGLPLCNEKQTLDEIFLVAKMYKCDVPETTWNGMKGSWVVTSTIEELNE